MHIHRSDRYHLSAGEIILSSCKSLQKESELISIPSKHILTWTDKQNASALKSTLNRGLNYKAHHVNSIGFNLYS